MQERIQVAVFHFFIFKQYCGKGDQVNDKDQNPHDHHRFEEAEQTKRNNRFVQRKSIKKLMRLTIVSGNEGKYERINPLTKLR